MTNPHTTDLDKLIQKILAIDTTYRWAVDDKVTEEFLLPKFYLDRLVKFIDQYALEARLDELEKFTHWYYFDRLEGDKVPIENYRDDRLATLIEGRQQK